MGGVLIQLVAYGAQDIHLTGNPEITYFKLMYRRHTNFSIESIEQTFNGDIDFGNITSAIIGRNGDLIKNIYIELELPQLNDTSTEWRGYINSLGYGIINYIELQIGGQTIDKHYGQWMDIYDELTDQLTDEFIGRFNKLYSLKQNYYQRKIYIPLRFWFNKNPGLALPLIALQNHEVQINLSLRPLNELIKADSNSFIIDDTLKITSGKIWIDYIFLDNDERRKFAQINHEYLITQTQMVEHSLKEHNGDSTITNKFELNFYHPVKEIIFTCQDIKNETPNDFVSGNNWLTYTSEASQNSDTFKNAKIQLNGQDRFTEREPIYFRSIIPYQYHSRTPRKYIYCYSFALYPEDNQPSGTCNFSRIENSNLVITFNKTNSVGGISNGKIKIYAVNYNILKIAQGTAGLLYSN